MRHIAIVCLSLLAAYCLLGCSSIVQGYADLLLDTRVRTEKRLNPGQVEYRQWDLTYHEEVYIQADRPDTTILVNGRPIGSGTATVQRPPLTVTITEAGFYHGYDYYDVTYREKRHGKDEIIAEHYRRTTRASGTRWIGQRVYEFTPEPITIQLQRDGQPPRTITVAGSCPDPVVTDAMGRLPWNDDSYIPAAAHATRYVAFRALDSY